LLSVAAAGLVPKARAAATKPNILFILADDFGYADLSCYGRREYATPNIDRLAAEGGRFTQAYANSAVCTASRVALITGRYQYRLPVGLEEPLGSNRHVAWQATMLPEDPTANTYGFHPAQLADHYSPQPQ
jgi:arylsulfatase A-like enzyme